MFCYQFIIIRFQLSTEQSQISTIDSFKIISLAVQKRYHRTKCTLYQVRAGKGNQKKFNPIPHMRVSFFNFVLQPKRLIRNLKLWFWFKITFQRYEFLLQNSIFRNDITKWFNFPVKDFQLKYILESHFHVCLQFLKMFAVCVYVSIVYGTTTA